MKPSQALQNKWIVNTRAVHQADSLSHLLTSAGANIIRFPLLSIEPPSNLQETERQLSSIRDYDLAIFISTNAVEQTLNKIEPSAFKSLKLACTGKKTALSLEQNGLNIDFCPKRFFNSEALLALESLQEFVAGKKIAIIKGEGGRNLLKQSLQKWGGNVDSIDVYKRNCPQQNLDILKNHHEHAELDIILLTSGFSVVNFFTLAEKKENGAKWFDSLTILLGSGRLKKHIPETFRGKVITAEDPNDETLLKELTTAYG